MSDMADGTNNTFSYDADIIATYPTPTMAIPGAVARTCFD
jgi:hypothetical protein